MIDVDPPRPWIRSYAEGVTAELPPLTGSLVDLVAASARDFPDAPALEFFGRETTYRALQDQIDRAAAALHARGVRAGDPVAIVLPNCPQHIVAFYAVLRLGAVVVEHNPLYTARELRKQFEDHGARHAIAWSKVVATLQDFPDDLPVPDIISVDITTALPATKQIALRLPVAKARNSRRALTEPVVDATPWQQIVAHEPLPASHPGPGTDDLAIIQYTSGTTGSPKGAALTHRNLLANAVQARSWVPHLERGKGCVFYAVLPMFHAYGLTLCVTFAMSMGARLVLFPKFDPDLVLAVVKKRPATVFPLVPPIADRLLAAARERGVSLQGIQIAISGAMALPHELVVPFEEATGGYLVEGYGLSECSPVLMVNPIAANREPGTVGLPLPGTECRVVDPDEPTVDVAPGERGELVVRGPQVFSGYYGHPEETERAFADGWFRTGDIVTIDEGGFVRIVDRIKELIITGGFNVAPTEVEIALRQHPQVLDAAVVGLHSPHSGEEVAAAIVVDGATDVDVDAVREFVRGILTPYKVPRRIFVVDELPRSMLGKVLRRQVRESLEKLIAHE
ncbi:long-chain-fatty-acid--CoA ligase [Microbacterium sp. zg.Y1090]|uniref:long-chain-fatty-acid--CoA ligase n=1 Tax=Microbacterium TaxID=33882 RepID=UPI00214BDCC9|nr:MULTISPECIES: long-chain-fatty-acid--CoA ligase [unclassified Microbacterium]MCR2811666.1 long-chain-fatty-acid--CoA ligase [Microbacterium sp. zg.Y1084]MCR2818896.1 long-chain-fatty-acid--CoA ligase [Microbacterium sp. zg.Y1090]MDL5486987.1 long-chain-fatty-acid--CoA ligase [Microbacterium sp. zg-Y1211]WIM27207.1 long-chain-fatty-acid--CoA ligase [Microbacterium sp. zg-Y1090]